MKRYRWLIGSAAFLLFGVGLVLASRPVQAGHLGCSGDTPVTRPGIAEMVNRLNNGGPKTAPDDVKSCVQDTYNQFDTTNQAALIATMWAEPNRLTASTGCAFVTMYAAAFLGSEGSGYTATGVYTQVSSDQVTRPDGSQASNAVFHFNNGRYNIGDFAQEQSAARSSMACIDVTKLQPGYNYILITYDLYAWGNLQDQGGGMYIEVLYDPPPVTVSGRVTTPAGSPVPGLEIETCTGQYPTTDANGYYSFQQKPGAGFCARIITDDPADIRTQKYNPEIGVTTSYEWQVAARNCYQTCQDDSYWWDLPQDYGYDLTINRDPKGYVDVADCNQIAGWAYDPDNSGASIDVHIYIDGAGVAAVNANQPRPDVNAAFGIGGNHGYRLSLPQRYKDTNAHWVDVYAINTPGGNNPRIGGGWFGPCVPQAPSIDAYCANGWAEAGISWQPRANTNYWVDISQDPNFSSYTNKYVGGATATTAPSGFAGGFSFNSGQTYYVRVFYTDGNYNVHSAVSTMVASSGCDRAPTITLSPDCTNQRVAVTVNDPDGSPSRVNYQVVDGIDGGAPSDPNGNPALASGSVTVSGNPGTVYIDMRGYNQYDPLVVTASTAGYTRPGSAPPSGQVAASTRYGYNPAGRPNSGCRDRTYTVTPTANLPELLPDEEAPDNANFSSRFSLVISPGQSRSGRGLRLTVTREFYHLRGSTKTLLAPPPNPVSDNNGGNPFAGDKAYGPENYRLPPILVGDKVCMTITVSTRLGTVDAASNAVTAQPADSRTACMDISNKPYLKVFGGSVAAGGTLVDAAGGCPSSPKNGQIITFARANGPVGSSAQFAAMVYGLIDGNATNQGFITATGPPSPNWGGLTFANNNLNLASGRWGGGLGYGHCVFDYYDTDGKYTRLPNPTQITGSTVNLLALQDGKQYQTSGSVTIVAPVGISIPNTKRVTIYVDGDVSISSDIDYTGAYLLDNPMPYVAVIARGNIYIDKAVDQLSGLYVAQPGPVPGSGQIYTCADGFSEMPESRRFAECSGSKAPALYTACSNLAGLPPALTSGRPLEVYGAFVARKVNFHRTNGTLRCATPSEGRDTQTAAEKFYLAPELYIGQPVFRPRSSGTLNDFGDVHSYSSLPPIF